VRLHSLIAKVRAKGIRGTLSTLKHRLLFGSLFTFFEKLGFHILPVHYYSPIPDTRELKKYRPQWDKEWSFTGVDFDLEGQLELVEELAAYRHECEALPPYAEVRALGLGEGYGELEAHILHTMVRHLKPKTIIEVGCGISTFFTTTAASLNRTLGGSECRIVCVEPYPQPAFRTFADEHGLECIPEPVQNVEMSLFQDLEHGDILFIDSSHIVKTNSDVPFLYLEVLPKLSDGVVIHIHDIPFPFQTPSPDHWLFGKHQFWTEAILVHAFLINNSAFRVRLCSSYLHYRARERLRATYSVYDPNQHFPSSLWLQKTSPSTLARSCCPRR